MRQFALLAAGLCAVTLQAADPALLNLVMPGATLLAGINVEKARTTPFGQFLLTQLPTGDALAGFIANSGFDPRQDLTELLMASNGDSKAGLVLAKGNFDPTKIADLIAQDGKYIAQTYKGAQLITGSAPKGNGAVAFLSSNIAVIGDLDSVKSAVDRSSGTNVIDPTLAARIAAFSSTDAWSISTSGIKFPDGTDNPLSGALKTIQQASGSIILSSPVQISAEATAASDQDATSLSDVLKFVAAMMGGNSQNNPAMALLNTLTVSTDHSVVKVQLSIPEEQLEELIKDFKPSGAKSDKKTL
jgi:hypothetical protein